MNPIAGRAPLPHAGSSAAWGGLEEKDEEGDGASVHHGAPPLQPGQHMGEEEWHASIRHAPPLDTHAPRPPLAQAFPSMTSFRTAHGVPPSPSGASLSSPLGQSHTASSPAHTASPSRPRSSWRAKLASAVKVALRSTHKEDEASEQGSVAGGSHVYAGAGGGAPLESERGRAPAPAPRPLYTLDDSGRGVFALVRRDVATLRPGPAAASASAAEPQPEPASAATYTYSPDIRVEAILARLEAERLSGTAPVVSPPVIRLVFEGRAGELPLLNPVVLGGGHAAVWPVDVMLALAMTGTLQEPWLRPVALAREVPVMAYYGDEAGMMDATPQAGVSNREYLPFRASPAHGGFEVVDAKLLVPGAVYEVVMEDKRDQAARGLSAEEVAAIEQQFLEMDHDGHGFLAQAQVAALIGQRASAFMHCLHDQFAQFLDTHPAPGDQQWAESLLLLHQQRLESAMQRLGEMLRRGDVEGDGRVSRQEFVLAEAWWRKSIMDPTRFGVFG